MSAKHDDQLVADISNLLSDESFHDVSIVLDNGVSVKGNKMVLSARSKFLLAQFKENLDTKEIRFNVASSKAALDVVMGYFYTGKIDYSSFGLSDLLDVLKLTRYMEMELSSQVEDYLLQELKDDQFKLGDILLLINDLVESKFDKVKDAVFNHFYLNIEIVSKHLEVKHIPQSYLEDLLRKDEDLINKKAKEVETDAISTEDEDYIKLRQVYKFDIFVNWLRGNEDCDHQFKNRMIKLFDLTKFPLDALFFKVRASNFYSEREILDALGMQMMDNFKEMNCKRKAMEEEMHRMTLHAEKLQNDHDKLKRFLTQNGYYRER